MSGWPQISMAAWLAAVGLSGLYTAVRPQWLMLAPPMVRKVALGMIAGAAVESLTLWAGCFWSR